jgi:hypothetical protein
MIEGFDFQLDETGELVVDQDSHEVNAVAGDELRIQMAYDRIKSVSTGWFQDNIGANLEELVGKPINGNIVTTGKDKIIDSLTFDGLWSRKDIHVQSEVTDALTVNYSVYLRIFDSETKEESSKDITITLDLIKGVKIKYGWQ